MADMMTFPDTWEEFEKIYGFDDSEEVYTNGSRLIQSFRVEQWLDHEENKRETKRQAVKSSERDIPMKPKETTDKAWGIPNKQAVCPKCDYYLGHIAFLDTYKGKRVTYCETCGQAIDWEGWEFDY